MGCDADQRASQGHSRCYYGPYVATIIAQELLIPFARFPTESIRFENTHGQVAVRVRIATIVGCFGILNVDPDGHALAYKYRHHECGDRKEKFFG